MDEERAWQNFFLHVMMAPTKGLSSMEKALQLVKEYEIATVSKFVVFKQSHDFGKSSK